MLKCFFFLIGWQELNIYTICDGKGYPHGCDLAVDTRSEAKSCRQSQPSGYTLTRCHIAFYKVITVYSFSTQKTSSNLSFQHQALPSNECCHAAAMLSQKGYLCTLICTLTCLHITCSFVHPPYAICSLLGMLKFTKIHDAILQMNRCAPETIWYEFQMHRL